MKIIAQRQWLQALIILIKRNTSQKIMEVLLVPDIGLTYVDYGNYDKENGEYFQKLAFSVTDIGFIKVNGEKHLYEGSPFCD